MVKIGLPLVLTLQGEGSGAFLYLFLISKQGAVGRSMGPIQHCFFLLLIVLGLDHTRYLNFPDIANSSISHSLLGMICWHKLYWNCPLVQCFFARILADDTGALELGAINSKQRG